VVENVVMRAEAEAWADEQIARVVDSPHDRLELLLRTYSARRAGSRRHLPYRRAAVSFMQWQLRRGVLQPLDADPPGSAWWRAVNERLLRDGCIAVALSNRREHGALSSSVELWTNFIEQPSSSHWYRAHNASIVGAYLDNIALTEDETTAERFFMNVALVRVLYAHALVGNPKLALGRCAPLGRMLGDPRLGMAGAFLSLGRVVPDRYPLGAHVERYTADEHHLGRLLDYAVIVPRIDELYAWSAEQLREPRLASLCEDGSPCYAWPAEARTVWQSSRPGAMAQAIGWATSPRH
jgi:hypothetical protein